MAGLRSDLSLARPEATTHAGLWLDRYVPDLERDGAGQEHIRTCLESCRVPAPYKSFFDRWRRGVSALPPHTVVREVEATGRLVVGLGGESVLETALTLHRTWALPYLPGQALKGLAARFAASRLDDEAWRRTAGVSHATMFGVQESAGHVTFHDALWVPSGDRLPLDLDVMTVHHPDYYQSGSAPPADWDSPTPVPFVSARGKYLLAITGPEAWAQGAMEILLLALAEEGIGAKTAAGYGRMRALVAAAPAAPDWRLAVRAVDRGNAANRVPEILASLSGDARKQAAQALVSQLDRKWLKDRADKEWVKLLIEASGAGA